MSGRARFLSCFRWFLRAVCGFLVLSCGFVGRFWRCIVGGKWREVAGLF